MTSYDDIGLVVERREPAADGVLVLTLRHPLGAGLPAWDIDRARRTFLSLANRA